MSQTRKPQVDIEKEIMTAIDLCGSEGASLDDIHRYLKSTLENNVPDLKSIELSLNNAVTKGLLLKLDNGKYKIKSSAERAEKDDEEQEEQDEDDDEYEVEIMTAIDLRGPEGASLDDIQQYLKSTLKNNVPDLESIQSSLNNAVSKEFLLELDNGKYKIKYYAKPEEEEADDNDDDDEDKNDEDEDEDDDEYEVEIMTAIDLRGPEGASLDDIQQYLKSTLKNNVPDLESLQSSLNNAVSKEFLLELDNGKYKIKYYAKPEEEEADDNDDDNEENDDDDNDEEDGNDDDDDDDEDYEEYGEDEENAQEVERSVDKVSKDANRNADSDTGNAGSSKAEEDANRNADSDAGNAGSSKAEKDANI